MHNLRPVLEERMNYLQKIKDEKERDLKKAPEGRLRISKERTRVQYYLCGDGRTKNGTYLSKNRKEQIQHLAQKEYDQKVLYAIEKEQSMIRLFLDSYPEKAAEEIYETMTDLKQDLIIPIWETNDMFVNQWNSEEYEGKAFSDDSPSLYSERGERVRSKTEVMIADRLYKEGVPYHYEYPVYLDGMGIVYPDFTILNVRLRKKLLWEHFGMMDNPEYAANAIRKLIVYQENGIFPGDSLIMTWETQMIPLDPRHISKLIRHYAF